MLRRAPWLVLLLAALASPARAQTPTALSWVRAPDAESCIGAQELAHAVERHVGPVLVAAPDGKLNVEGHVGRAGAGYLARIVMSDDTGAVLGTRELESDGDDCRSLDGPIAFVIAVAIDPDAALAELPGELTPTDDVDPGAELLQELEQNPPGPRARPTPTPEPTPEPEPEPEGEGEPLYVTVGLGGGFGVGVLQEPVSLAGRLEGTLELGHTWVLLDATLWLPDRFRVTAGDQTVELNRWDLGLSACPIAGTSGSAEVAICLGLVMSRLLATPSGFASQQREVSRLLWSPRVSGRLAYRFSQGFGLQLRLDLLRSIPQHSINYGALGQLNEVHRVADLTAMAAAGLFLRF